MTLISVIIPTYNRASLVCKAILSAVGQTYINLEIIVVDDGSTDGTAELVATFGGRVRYISKTNGGVSSARNLGIRESSGGLIAFLDSDDQWAPDKLEKQASFLQQRPDFGMVLCDCLFIDPSGKDAELSRRRKHLPNDGYILEDVLKSPSLIPSSVLVKKSVLDDVGYFDENIKTAEDLDLHLRIASKYRIGLVTEPLVTCMRNHEGLSMESRTYEDHVHVLERFVRLNSGRINGLAANKALLETYTSAANGKFWMREWSDGIHFNARAAKYIGSFDDLAKVCRVWAKGVKYFLT